MPRFPGVPLAKGIPAVNCVVIFCLNKMRNLRNKPKLQGGEIIGSGADTCVFRERLQCTSPLFENLAKAYEARGIPLVSRVVEVTAQNQAATREISVEQLLLERVKTLEMMGHVKAAVFCRNRLIVSVVQCRPIFLESDLKPAEQVNRCYPNARKVGFETYNYIALQTPQYLSDMNVFMKRLGLKGSLEDSDRKQCDHYLADIGTVLMHLNREEYPSIFVHSDLHVGNVCISMDDHGCIADFGRASWIPNQSRPSDVFVNFNIPIGPDAENYGAWSDTYFQWIPEATFVYILALLWPQTVPAKVAETMKLSDEPLIQKLVQAQRMNDDETMYTVMMYILRFWDLFGLVRCYMKAPKFAHVRHACLTDLWTLYETEFKQGTLTTARVRNMLQKYLISRDQAAQESTVLLDVQRSIKEMPKSLLDIQKDFNTQIQQRISLNPNLFQEFLDMTQRNPELAPNPVLESLEFQSQDVSEIRANFFKEGNEIYGRAMVELDRSTTSSKSVAIPTKSKSPRKSPSSAVTKLTEAVKNLTIDSST